MPFIIEIYENMLTAAFPSEASGEVTLQQCEQLANTLEKMAKQRVNGDAQKESSYLRE